MHPDQHTRLTHLSHVARFGQWRSALGQLALIGATLLALGLCSPAVHAQNYYEQPVHSFTGSTTDGSGPENLLLYNGIIYGVTRTGGTYNFGDLFSYDPSTNIETDLYNFQGGANDGKYPAGGLIAVNGKLYGVTVGGGPTGSYGFGTVYSFDPATNKETILYFFQGDIYNQPPYPNSQDGGEPFTGLTYDSASNTLYGTTLEGGYYNSGTIFSIHPDGSNYQVRYSFDFFEDSETNKDDAGQVVDPLILVNGILYGVSTNGGQNVSYYITESGTLFSFDPSSNTEKVLSTFDDQHGYQPTAGLTNVGGILYGTTSIYGSNGASSSGAIFSYNPGTASLSALHSFGATATDGANPAGRLLNSSGIFYGTTVHGGTTGQGTFYSFDPATSTATTLYSFVGGAADGSNPTGNLISVNGTFYGTTRLGGTNNLGTIFALKSASLVAADDTYSPQYHTAYVVKAPGVLANDNAEGTGTMTAALVSGPAHGALTLNSDGSFVYTPNSGFVGTDLFRYYATNSAGRSNTAIVTLTVRAVVPVAKNDSYAVRYETQFASGKPGVLANDYDGDTGAFTASLVSTTTHGSLTFDSAGNFLYKPVNGYAGTDSFTYQAVDPVGKSNTVTVTLTVSAAAPIAKNDSYTPKFETAYVVGAAKGILVNDDTGGSSPMTAVLVTNPSHGTVTLNADGSYRYTPSTGYLGADSFTYQAVNAVGTSNTATVSLTVMAGAPTAYSDSGSALHNTAAFAAAPGVLGNDFSAGSSPMTAVLVTGPSHGTVTLNADGSYLYTPNAGYSGTDRFTYQAVNGIGKSNIAPVTMTVR